MALPTWANQAPRDLATAGSHNEAERLCGTTQEFRHAHGFPTAHQLLRGILTAQGEDEMDISAALTTQEIIALSDPTRTLEQASRVRGQARGTARERQDSFSVGFEESVKLKNTLDVIEAQGVDTQ